MKDKVIVAFDRGYRVKANGSIFHNDIEIKGQKIGKGYLCFNIYIKPKYKMVLIHRLQAFQKFGNEIFNDGIVVRHLDGNKLNNSFSNIEIGTLSQNYHDIPLEKINIMKAATSIRNRKNSIENIRKIAIDRKNGMKYSELSQKYGVSLYLLSYYLGKNRKSFINIFETTQNENNT